MHSGDLDTFLRALIGVGLVALATLVPLAIMRGASLLWRAERPGPMMIDTKAIPEVSGADHDKVKAEARAMIARAFTVLFEKHGGTQWALSAIVEGMLIGIATQLWASRRVGVRAAEISRYMRGAAKVAAGEVCK